jgi:glycosyltransferase involved in cell wall biosynthesis
MLTVLFATRNRARLLLNVLNSFCHLQAPASGWKLVIVDNGSTDDTAPVVTSFADRLPLHLVSEPKPGKNAALNAGLDSIEGDLTVLTDDDVFPHPNWLVQLRKAADAQPQYVMFGGAIMPRWETPPPEWVAWVDKAAVYTLTDPSLKEGAIDPTHVFGPNMAIRSSVFQSGLRLDPGIGPRGDSYPMGSETEFVLRLGRLGHRAWYVPDALVEHFVRAEQLEKVWVLKRAVRFGRGQYRLFRKNQTNGMLLGTPPYLFRKMLKQVVVMGWARLAFKRESLFRANWRLNVFRGQAIEARILAREACAAREPATEPARGDS